ADRAKRNIPPEREAEFQRRVKAVSDIHKILFIHKSTEREAPPAWLPTAGKNLALDAKISVSSTRKEGGYDAKYINDGKYDFETLDGRWLSEAKPEAHWIELHFAEPVSVNAVRIVSGSLGTGDPITAFVLQRKNGDQWVDIPKTKTEHNWNVDFGKRFDKVTGSAFRLYITETRHNIARIKEVELYEIP
ncbi:MAG: discoidin domain-containing protein, partial [Planctomycetaceae bacterium]|nr:discoidin domain-containing protein [Planctomycetaceae bacterium]